MAVVEAQKPEYEEAPLQLSDQVAIILGRIGDSGHFNGRIFDEPQTGLLADVKSMAELEYQEGNHLLRVSNIEYIHHTGDPEIEHVADFLGRLRGLFPPEEVSLYLDNPTSDKDAALAMWCDEQGFIEPRIMESFTRYRRPSQRRELAYLMQPYNTYNRITAMGYGFMLPPSPLVPDYEKFPPLFLV